MFKKNIFKRLVFASGYVIVFFWRATTNYLLYCFKKSKCSVIFSKNKFTICFNIKQCSLKSLILRGQLWQYIAKSNTLFLHRNILKELWQKISLPTFSINSFLKLNLIRISNQKRFSLHLIKIIVVSGWSNFFIELLLVLERFFTSKYCIRKSA